MFDPGSQHSYSSGGFSVLARVLELAGEASFSELLHRYVFEPAGMTDTCDSDELDGEIASSYRWTPDGLVSNPYKDLTFLVGAGSVWSTPRDLFRLQRAIERGDLGDTVKANSLRPDGFSWNGVTGGYRAFADYDARTGVSVIFAANIQTGAADRLRADIPRIVNGHEVEVPVVPEITAVAVDEEILRGYTGTYEMRPGSTLDVRPRDGVLLANDWILLPTSETTFFSPQDYGVVEVILDEQGAPLHLEWLVGGATSRFPRIDAGS